MAKGTYKMKKVMAEFEHGTLHSGAKHGPKGTSHKQAVAIGLDESRKAGARISFPKTKYRYV